MNHVHFWIPAEWDKRFDKCKYCHAARLSEAEYKRKCDAVDQRRRELGTLEK